MEFMGLPPATCHKRPRFECPMLKEMDSWQPQVLDAEAWWQVSELDYFSMISDFFNHLFIVAEV